MTNILFETISQWGTAGIMMLAAGYLLWDNWKKNKKLESNLLERMNVQVTKESIGVGLDNINTKLDKIQSDHQSFRDQISARIDNIEEVINKHHPSHHQLEEVRMNALAQIAPSIHTIINEGLNICKADHIAVALLHNGQTSLSGIPYIKFGIIAEKYKPIRHPQDIDLVVKYKEEDIMSHNRLPSCIIHNNCVEFEIQPDSPLVDIDPVIYNRALALGIKRLAIEAIKDVHGMCTGFVVIYKFDDSALDMTSLHNTTKTIENLYCEMMINLQ